MVKDNGFSVDCRTSGPGSSTIISVFAFIGTAIKTMKLNRNSSAVDNFLWMVYSTHHVNDIWCTPKPECVRYDYQVKNLIIVMIA